MVMEDYQGMAENDNARIRKEIVLGNIEVAHTKIKDQYTKELLTLEIIKLSKLQGEESIYSKSLIACKDEVSSHRNSKR